MDKGKALTLLTEIHNEKMMELEKEKEFFRRNLVKVKASENILVKQNKRYREALEDIAELSSRSSMNEFVYGQLARQALEGDPNESS